MPRPKFRVYDTRLRKYLRQMTLPTGDRRAVFTDWTYRPELAARYTLAQARNIAGELSDDGEIVIHDDRGREIP